MDLREFKKQMKKVRVASSILSPKEKKVLKGRWGFYFTEKQPLRELGGKLGISCEMVRQIENTAMKKMTECLEELKK